MLYFKVSLTDQQTGISGNMSRNTNFLTNCCLSTYSKHELSFGLVHHYFVGDAIQQLVCSIFCNRYKGTMISEILKICSNFYYSFENYFWRRTKQGTKMHIFKIMATANKWINDKYKISLSKTFEGANDEVVWWLARTKQHVNLFIFCLLVVVDTVTFDVFYEIKVHKRCTFESSFSIIKSTTYFPVVLGCFIIKFNNSVEIQTDIIYFVNSLKLFSTYLLLNYQNDVNL